jgi:hypothetical protein
LQATVGLSAVLVFCVPLSPLQKPNRITDDEVIFFCLDLFAKLGQKLISEQEDQDLFVMPA